MAKKIKKTKPANKRLKKEIKALRKNLKAERKRVTKAVKTTTARSASLRKGLDRLKSELEKYARKKTPKKQLSEYNLFMRRQLLAGKTFATAVRMWKAYSGGKMLVRTKVRTVTKTRTIVKRAKPRIITRTIVKRIQSKPRVITRTIVKEVPVEASAEKKEAEDKKIISGINETVSKIMQSDHSSHKETKHVQNGQVISDEELAFKLLTLYFQEVARLGLKRQLEMKDVIDAYYETLEKVRAKKISGPHIAVEHKIESKHNEIDGQVASHGH